MEKMLQEDCSPILWLYSYSFSNFRQNYPFRVVVVVVVVIPYRLHGLIRQGRLKVSRHAFVLWHGGESFQQGLCTLNEGFHV